MRFRFGAARKATAEDIEGRIAALGLGAPMTIRPSARARRVSLRIDAAARSVELVLPPGVPAGRGLDFAAAHRGWIAARLAALPAPVGFAEGASVPVLGVAHRIVRSDDPGGPPVAISDGEIRVRGDPAHLSRRVRDHLVELARRELTARSRTTAARLGKSVARVTVRDLKSRWGSCTAKGRLTYNWRLIFAPEAVVDYVVAHEVAHLAEMNHGVRFWRLVATLVPDVAAPRAWLKRHRAELMSCGA